MSGRFLSVAFLLASLTACGGARRPVVSSPPAFDRIYQAAAAHDVAGAATVKEETVTLSSAEMPLPEFLRLIAVQTRASVSWNDSLENRKITAELNEVPLSEVMGLVARRLGSQVSRVGSSWFVGDIRAEDRGVMVRTVRRLTGEGIRSACATVVSDNGRFSVYDDGLLVAADRVEVLQRLGSLLDGVEASRPGVWVVQLYLISVTDEASQQLGFKPDELVKLSHAFAYSSAIGSSRLLQTSFNAVLEASGKTEGVKLVAKPLALLGDGETGKVRSGVTVPIARKTVSNEGVVQTQGFDFIQVGVNSTVTLREMSATSAKITVAVDQGQITGYVENAPIQSKDEFGTVATVEAGGVYLLGSLVRTETHRGKQGLARMLPVLFTASDKSASIQVWARIERVAGGVVQQ